MASADLPFPASLRMGRFPIRLQFVAIVHAIPARSNGGFTMRQRMKPFTILTFFLVIAAIIVSVLRYKAVKRNAVDNSASPDLELAPDQSLSNDFEPRTFLDDEDNKKRAKLLRLKLERDGALAEVDCRVTDRFGNTISNADIRFYFDTKEKNCQMLYKTHNAAKGDR